jgi:hypothetical protein
MVHYSVQMSPKIPEYKIKGHSGKHEIASLLCNISNIILQVDGIGELNKTGSYQ